MNKLFGYGFPFDVNSSSCSNRKPKNFEWSLPKYSGIDKLVLIDNTIMQYEQLPPGIPEVYGWVCESRSVVNNLSHFLAWNYDKLEKRFKTIFVSDKNLVSFSKVFKYCPAGSNLPWVPESEYAIYDKTKLVSMVASHKQYTKGHIIRHEYANRFKDNLDLFGGACGSPKLPETDPTQPWKSKMFGLKDYMFHIVIENDFYDGYYTEKLTDCFATGTIPVYLGNPAIGELFNTNGIILLNETFDIKLLTPELYYSKLDAVEENFDKIKKLQSSDDYLWNEINETNYS